MNFSSKKRGFTLIEMLIVIVIIGVLASALIPRLGSARGKANDVGRKADLQQLATAIISYQIDKNYFPQTSQQIQATGTVATELKQGGMASIPVGDGTTVYTGADGVTNRTGYFYMPLVKNGGAGNGFLIMSRAETEGGANYVKCSSTNPANITTSTDVDTLTLCSEISYDPSGTCTSSTTNVKCVATNKNQLLYIYKY